METFRQVKCRTNLGKYKVQNSRTDGQAYSLIKKKKSDKQKSGRKWNHAEGHTKYLER